MNKLLYADTEVQPEGWQPVDTQQDGNSPAEGGQDGGGTKEGPQQNQIKLKPKFVRKKKRKADWTEKEINRSPLNEQTGYGGDPDQIPVGMDPHQSDSTKEFFYAPGEGGMSRGSLNPLFYGSTETVYHDNEQLVSPTEPATYQDRIEETGDLPTPKRRRFGNKPDKESRLDRVDHPSGLPEPPEAMDIGMGNMVYPLSGISRKEDAQDDKNQIALTYFWEQIGKQYPDTVTIQLADLQEPGRIEDRPVYVMVMSETGHWEIDEESSDKRPRTNFPKERFDTAEESILKNLPKFLRHVEQKMSERADYDFNLLTDPALVDLEPAITDVEKLFTTIDQWEKDRFTADFAKLDDTTQSLLKQTPTGKGTYFEWKFISEADIEKSEFGGGRPVVIITKLPAWDQVATQVQEARNNP